MKLDLDEEYCIFIEALGILQTKSTGQATEVQTTCKQVPRTSQMFLFSHTHNLVLPEKQIHVICLGLEFTGVSGFFPGWRGI